MRVQSTAGFVRLLEGGGRGRSENEKRQSIELDLSFRSKKERRRKVEMARSIWLFRGYAHHLVDGPPELTDASP